MKTLRVRLLAAVFVALTVLAHQLEAESASRDVLLFDGRTVVGWGINPGLEFPGASGTVTEVLGAEGPCLRLDADFTQGGRYCGIERGLTLPPTKALSFEVQAEQAIGIIVRLRDATDQEHIVGVQVIPGAWQTITLPLTKETFGNHWQGADDGVFHFPLTRLLIALNRAEPTTASCLLRNITVRTADPSQFWQLDVCTDMPGNILFTEEQPQDIWLALRNCLSESATAGVRWTVTDHTGTVVAQGEKNLHLAAWEAIKLPIHPANPHAPGYYHVQAWIDPPRPAATLAYEGGVGIVDKPLSWGQPDPQSYFGIHAASIDCVTRIGVKWIRSQCTWLYGEARRGDYDFSQDSTLDKAREQKVHVMMTLEYRPPDWARQLAGDTPLWPPPPALLQAWSDYVTACVRRYDDIVDVWEIQNEPDLTCFYHVGIPEDMGVQSYVDIYQTAHAAIRAAGSTHPVAGVDVSGGDYRRNLAFSRAVLARIADIVDIYTGHPYASPRYFGEGKSPLFPHENHLVEKLENSRAMVAEYGGRPLWVGEKGWGLHISEPLGGPQAYAYAACTSQALATGRSVKGVERWFWFLERGCNEQGHEYGLWRVLPAQPLPAAVTYAVSARMLHHVEPGPPLTLPEGIVGFSYSCSERDASILALWSLRDEFTLRDVSWPAGSVAADGYGRSVPVEQIPLRITPVYIQARSKDIGALCSVAEAAAPAPKQPVAIEAVFLSARNTVTARLRNKTSTRQTLEFSWLDNTRAVGLLPRERQAVAITVAPDRAPGALLSIVQEGTPTRTFPIPDVPRPCMSEADALPGTAPESWGAPAETIVGRSTILPPDPNIGWHGDDDLSMAVWYAWRPQGLRIAVVVRDDVHSAPRWGVGTFWNSDSLQIAFDLHNDAGPDAGFDGNDREFGMVLGPDGAHVIETFPRSRECLGVPCAARRTEGQTVYEVILPWERLGVTAQIDRVIGLNVIANDNDGHGRECWIGMTPGIGEAKRPILYRDITLAE